MKTKRLLPIVLGFAIIPLSFFSFSNSNASSSNTQHFKNNTSSSINLAVRGCVRWGKVCERKRYCQRWANSKCYYCTKHRYRSEGKKYYRKKVTCSWNQMKYLKKIGYYCRMIHRHDYSKYRTCVKWSHGERVCRTQCIKWDRY